MRYYQTYFNIECGYCTGTNDRSDQCLLELEEMFRNAGWTVKVARSTGRCPQVELGKSSLYCHPTQVSGPMEESLIPQVEEMLRGGKSFRFWKTDKEHELYDIAPEDFPVFIKAKHGNTADTEILKRCKTKKSNNYFLLDAITHDLALRFDIPTLKNPYISIPSAAAVRFTKERIEHLASTGDIVSIIGRNKDTQGKTLVRTATAADRKARTARLF